MSATARVAALAVLAVSTCWPLAAGASPAAAQTTHTCPPGMHWVPADNACDDNPGGGGAGGGGGTGGAAFTWSVTNRTVDRGDGVVDESVVHDPTHTTLTFNACSSSGGGSVISSYTWTTLDGQNSVTTSSRSCTTSFTVPLDGTWNVSLTVTNTRGASFSTSQLVHWHDYLIASLGDSAASGEGNPDTPAPPALRFPPGDPALAGWADLRCDRSGRAAAAQAALQVENSDPHTSVTFLPLACSGASIGTSTTGDFVNGHYTGGILTPYDGQIPPGAETGGTATMCPTKVSQPTCDQPLDPQITVLADMARAANRPLDALYLTVGADDTHWSSLFSDCIKYNKIIPYYCEAVDGPDVLRRLATVPSRFAQLAGALSALTLPDGRPIIPANRVFITEYWDPTHDESPTGFDPVCFHGLGGLLLGGDLSAPGPSDRQWGYDNVLKPLNDMIAQAAHANQWNLVTGIASDFYTHGDCALFAPWVNSLGDSLSSQADDFGTWHANAPGQADIAQHLLASSWPTLSAQSG